MHLSHLHIVNFSLDHIQKKHQPRIKRSIDSSRKIHNTNNDNFNSSQYLLGIFFVPSTPLKALHALVH